MIAARLSSVWQVAGVAVAALCCYLVSQSVATERANLAKVDRQIAATKDEIAKLSTEIGARSRFTQLDSWNGTFGLKAPRPAQYVESGVQLASFYGRKGQPALRLDPAIAVQQGSPHSVAYQVPAPAAPKVAPAPAPEIVTPPAPVQPMLRAATYVRPKTTALGVADDAVPVLTQAAYHSATAAKPAASASLLPDDIGTLIAREEAKDGKAKRAKADR
jgi:hypothetical protein